MRARDLRLLPLAGAVWVVALLCVFQSGIAWPCTGLCAGGAMVAVAVGSRRGGRASATGLVAVILAVCGAVCVAVGIASPARAAAAVADGRAVEITAGISSSASIGRDGRLWFEAITSSVGIPGEAQALSVPVRVGVEPDDGFDLGATIRVVGEATATEKGERSALVVFARTVELVSPAVGVFGAAAGMRSAFIERSLGLPEPGAGLLPGLAVGDTRAVSAELTEAMRTSGLSHLTAVSGANCAIVVGAVFWLTALCNGGRMLRVALAAVALAGFVVLVTPEPSVVRAGVMAGVAMVTILCGRPSAGAAMLALCTTGILCVDPWLAATPGFALSVAASGALILLAPPLARGLRRIMPESLALAVAVPLSAQLACGPIVALFAEQQSLVGIAANLIAAPAAPIATVIGVLACLAAPLPPLADLLAACAWLPAAWIATTATTAAHLPVAEVLIPAGVGSAVIVALVSASIALVILQPRAGGPRGQLRNVLQVAAAAVLAVVLSLAGARVLLDGPLSAATVPDDWVIAACDVGQGDAVLVRSDDAVALIDTGPDPAPLEACLRSLGIARVDLLVLSHFDLDHAGGATALHGRVGTVVHGPTGDPEDERLLADLIAGGATASAVSSGSRGVLGAATWRVLWPVDGSLAFAPGNDASVVVEFAGGGVPRSLFLGDLSAAPQRMLARNAPLGDYTVVKVAHHGSAGQDPGLYEELSADVALFTAGADNDYGHPRDEALDILASTGAHILRTDQQGRILLGLRDGELQVWIERPAPP